MKSSRLLPFYSLLAMLVLSPIGLEGASITPIKRIPPRVPELHLGEETAEVEILARVNRHGYVTEARIQRSTDARADQACLDAARQWRFAVEGNVDKVLIHFRITDDAVSTGDRSPRSRDPRPVRRVLPERDESLRAITGSVYLVVDLDAEGAVVDASVQSSTHPELEPPALAAVRQWRFSPALRDDVPVPSRVGVPFHFEADRTAVAKMRREAEAQPLERPLKVVRTVDPVLSRADREASGEAVIAMLVDANGFVAEASVVSATSAVLGETAREAALGWKFRPAIRGGEAVPTTVHQPFVFNGGVVLSAADEPVDRLPQVIRRVKPEVPDELIGVEGFVDLIVTVDAEGRVVEALASRSSHEEYEDCALRAVRRWQFRPAVRGGKPVPSRLLVPIVFSL